MTADGDILGTLVHIQSHLDFDLSLEQLSRRAGQSKWHFQRRFTDAVGETPARYVERLRVERAAFSLRVQNSTLLQIALDCGFQNHETFTRAFNRCFGISPSHFRREGTVVGRKLGIQPNSEDHVGFELSSIKVRPLRPCHLAFARHVGSYDKVPQGLFDSVKQWADSSGVQHSGLWLGIGHDAPSTTSADRLRFDAALIVPGPFRSTGLVGYQRFDGGLHAIATHVGPFSTLEAAYVKLLQDC